MEDKNLGCYQVPNTVHTVRYLGILWVGGGGQGEGQDEGWVLSGQGQTCVHILLTSF